ncbi:MAG: hypothetical protein LBG08_04015 [Spirochaetaceae bacterium]|jgi:hypothetical protein|nr:hypothetical protein [Spirochaetaceae bacterium]
MKIEKNPYLPLRLAFFIYDFFRLLFMLELLIAVLPLGNTSTASWFPYLVYVVPNALFPLMGFFLLIRPREYKAYISLYLAGKTIVIVSIFGWTIFSFKSIFTSTVSSQEFITILGFVLGLTILDMGSLLGSSLLKNKINRLAAPESGEITEGEEIAEGDSVPEGSGVS